MNEEYTSTMQKLAGVWRLVTSEFRTAGGNVMYPLGEDALGLAIFTESGYMSGQLMRPGRPNFASNNQALGTPDEIQQSFLGYIAYYGRCELDLQSQTITTHVEGSMYPNWVGSEQVRFYELGDDRLVLRTPPITLGDEEITGVLTWQRQQ
ncbi:MAG: lipocalin-like domain-containing protein [Pseudomonadales bacterium]|nr:lipocalin-like domain-containing protein [Pseudomonadales bacterium]